MATYKVKLGSSEGDVLFKQVFGQSAAEVRNQFTGEGYYVFSVKKNIDPMALLGGRRQLPIRKFLVFNKELRGLIRAGMPIVEGLDILLSRMKPGRQREMLEQVRAGLERGESLSEAFVPFKDIIPRYYPALVHAGEQSGNLAMVLERFIDQEENLRLVRKKFRQALTYPAVLLVAGMISLYIILTRAMPEFVALYQNSSDDLPLVTRIVMAMSTWLNTWYVPLMVGVLVAAAAFHFWRQTESGAALIERVWRRAPLLGSMWQLHNQNIFSRCMNLLLGGGIPVPQAIAAVADAVPSRAFGLELHKVNADLVRGQSLQDAMDQHTRLSEMAGEMIRVGEATGTLGEMFEYVAEHGEEQSADYLELISGLVAPLMLVLIGLLIAFMVVAMYLPMFGSYERLGL